MRPRKVDTTHTEIKAVLLANGWQVKGVHSLPEKCLIIASKDEGEESSKRILIECNPIEGIKNCILCTNSKYYVEPTKD